MFSGSAIIFISKIDNIFNYNVIIQAPVVKTVDSAIHLSNNRVQDLVARKLENAIHWINRYPADSVVCFATTYLVLDSDLSSTRATSHAFGASRLANSDLQNKTDYIAVYQ